MALALFCAAGFGLGVAFDLFALVCAMMLAGSVTFLLRVGAGTGTAFLTASGVMIALQSGFALGLASLLLEGRLRSFRSHLGLRRPKL